MREVTFLRRNAEKWKQFEVLLAAPGGTDPDRLADLYVQLTDDLAYARTFFADSQTTQYLNGLAAQVHRRLYGTRREDRGRFVRFWRYELPAVLRTARTELLVSLTVFALAVGVGLLSAAGDTGFSRLILGDAYLNMTLDNIAAGDPMAVYKQEGQLGMFAYITMNNIWVSFTAFALGAVASVGTGYVLFQNGVMLGAFHYLFYEQGLLAESLLVIYIHGALEISSIVIAGAAGLVMGNSLLFPGTYPRRVSFLRGARKGLKIVIGLVPLFIVAGFLEGFVTRHTEMPAALSLTIILSSLGFIAWYFGYYPYATRSRQA